MAYYRTIENKSVQLILAVDAGFFDIQIGVVEHDDVSESGTSSRLEKRLRYGEAFITHSTLI